MRITRLRLAAVAATALAATVALAGCSGTSDASGSAALPPTRARSFSPSCPHRTRAASSTRPSP
jgi:hypothetical protein